jgi:hypothetical protein
MFSKTYFFYLILAFEAKYWQIERTFFVIN